MVIDSTNGMSQSSGIASDNCYNLTECLVNAPLIRQAHNDRISVLRVTERTIISASYDRTVKLWDKNTNKQVQHITQILHTPRHTYTDAHHWVTAFSFIE